MKKLIIICTVIGLFGTSYVRGAATGRLVTWGLSEEAPTGDFTDISVAMYNVLALRNNGSIVFAGWGVRVR